MLIFYIIARIAQIYFYNKIKLIIFYKLYLFNLLFLKNLNNFLSIITFGLIKKKDKVYFLR